MSSNIRILKICEYCKREFIARKTVSKTCSDNCAKRFYKLKTRNAKISKVELETKIKPKSSSSTSYSNVEEIKGKENLTLKEAAFVLNISPLTMRRWILSGKVKSIKIGKKHCIKHSELITSFQT